MNKKYLFILLVFVGGLFFIFRFNTPARPVPDIRTFEDCIVAGYPIMESYPRRCVVAETQQSFVEYIGNELEKNDFIRILSPRPNAVIKSPLSVMGEARGFWFFEASFPVELVDKYDKRIAIGIATAEGEWATTDFVPFTATLEFIQPTTTSGTLYLRKDNPSGLPEHDDTLLIPVKF